MVLTPADSGFRFLPINCRTPKSVKSFQQGTPRNQEETRSAARSGLHFFGKSGAWVTQVRARNQRLDGAAETHPANRRIAGGTADKNIVGRKFFTDGVAARIRKINPVGFADFSAQPHGFL